MQAVRVGRERVPLAVLGARYRHGRNHCRRRRFLPGPVRGLLLESVVLSVLRKYGVPVGGSMYVVGVLGIRQSVLSRCDRRYRRMQFGTRRYLRHRVGGVFRFCQFLHVLQSQTQAFAEKDVLQKEE